MYGASRCVDQNSNRPTWVLAEKMHLILTKIGQLVCQVMKILGFSKFQICFFCKLYVCIVQESTFQEQ